MTPPELPLPPSFITTHFDPLTGEDDSADTDAGSLGLVTTRIPKLQIAPPDTDYSDEEIASWAGAVSRNAPCPCGSGRKYKHCHGARSAERRVGKECVSTCRSRCAPSH